MIVFVLLSHGLVEFSIVRHSLKLSEHRVCCVKRGPPEISNSPPPNLSSLDMGLLKLYYKKDTFWTIPSKKLQHVMFLKYSTEPKHLALSHAPQHKLEHEECFMCDNT